VSILAEHVTKKIITQVKESKYFCIISDSTPDISPKDQMSEALRYVKMDGNEVKVEESFLRVIETKGKSAEEISGLIFAELEKDGIPIDDYVARHMTMLLLWQAVTYLGFEKGGGPIHAFPLPSPFPPLLPIPLLPLPLPSISLPFPPSPSLPSSLPFPF
jgi:hypothetical protein